MRKLEIIVCTCERERKKKLMGKHRNSSQKEMIKMASGKARWSQGFAGGPAEVKVMRTVASGYYRVL